MNKKMIRLVLVLPLLAVVFTACQKTPEERVAKLRTYYTARLLSFIVDAVPVPEEPAEELMMAEEGADPSDAEPAGADPEAPPQDVEPVPTLQNVKVDILIQHDSPEKLPGITLDIEMVDAQEQPKDNWKIWVDTSKLPKATGHQFVHQLEDIDYVEGDGFSVEVRSPVPVEERGDYREFSPAPADPN